MKVKSIFTILVILAAACMAASVVSADTLTLTPILCGEDLREDAPEPCSQESAFTCGVASTELNLHVGGTSWGCDSEWATSIEFALGQLPSGSVLQSAALVVRKTGYSDDSQGFFYLGVFDYPADGQAVSVERSDLTPDTALGVLYPPASNVDMEFTVTDVVQEALSAGDDRVGLVLAGVYSEAGYEDWISVGGIGHTSPPRLVVTFTAPVPTTGISWSELKGMFRGP